MPSKWRKRREFYKKVADRVGIGTKSDGTLKKNFFRLPNGKVIHKNQYTI